jgi:hypothetical protein
MAKKTATTSSRRNVRRNATLIDPAKFYTRKHFLEVAGLTTNQLYKARDLGVVLTTTDIGTRMYLEGKDGIEFIKAYSKALKAAEEAAGPDDWRKQ